jgi:2-keto-4-pentenoate hydratase/2-oxohepta-3-ene-1,7-dioic acid hydratase in catechol pathway
MKLARCSDGGAPFWGVVDVEAGTLTPIAGRFDQWAPRLTRGEGAAALTLSERALPLSGLRLLPPIEKINRVVVAGANYTKHLVEFGLAAPAQPFSFLKA